jgi:thioredoxin reductase
MHDLIIIGGGAAGMAAAAYAVGKGLNIQVIADWAGGKAGQRQYLRGEQQEELLIGYEAVQQFERLVVTHPQRMLRDSVKRIEKANNLFNVHTVNHGVQSARAVIIATGAAPVPLEVPGATHLVGQGLGYSITTHAHLVTNKTVVIIGSTLRALRGANEIAQRSLAISLIATNPADLNTPLAWALRRWPNIELIANATVIEILGDTNVEGIVIMHNGQQRTLPCDAVFCDLGLVPNTGFVWQTVQVDTGGFIRVDDQNATNVPGIFAAGDVTTSFGEQVLIAIGDGARAALSAYDYLLANPV